MNTQRFTRVVRSPEWEHDRTLRLALAKEDDGLHGTIDCLDAWTRLLRTVAGYPKQRRVEMFQLFSRVMRRPYLFEQNTGRWPDGLFHLVDRGYKPFKGASYTLAELELMGVIAWQRHCFVALTPWCHAVMDDEFEATPAALRHVANITSQVAGMVDKRAQASAERSAA